MNIPNILSLFRILLIPVAAYFFAVDNFTAALIVFVLACATDVLDGYIARKFNLITDIGTVLDPLADKGMQVTVLISMSLHGIMPWIVAIFFLVKELTMFLGGVFLYKKSVIISANWYGKLSTVITSLCVCIILLFKDVLSIGVLTLFQWLPVVCALMAFARYTMLYIKEKNGEGKNLHNTNK